SIPYDAAFDRKKYHSSNKYWGASLSAFTHLAKQKNYSLIGSNLAGNNCYFLRNDYLGIFEVATPETCWRLSKFRETRIQKELVAMSVEDFYTTMDSLEFVDVIDGSINKA